MAKVKSAATIKIPSVLSFARVIEPTDGFFHQKDSKNENGAQPLSIAKRSIRTTMSNRQKPAISNNPEKMNAEIIKTNIQNPEICYLDEHCNILIANFGVKFLPFNGVPVACNEASFGAALEKVVSEYAKETQFKEISIRYANNIANARWLWRNRLVSRAIKVNVECQVDDDLHHYSFDAKQLSIKEFDDNEQISALAGFIAAAFRGEIFLSVYVSAEADIGYGHQAFPSEEMNLDKDNKDKQLFARNNVAGLHAPKIGNAIRTIDTWYPSDDDKPMPISIEAFGAVTNKGVAYRQPANSADFYDTFDRWIANDEMPDMNTQHYIMAMLIRGGLFGLSSK